MISHKERREGYIKRRRVVALWKSILITLGIVGLLGIAIAFAVFRKTGQVVDTKAAILFDYEGLQGYAQAKPLLDRESINEQIKVLFGEYDSAVFPLKKKYTLEDYQAFADSVQLMADRTESLSNGDEVKVTISCNEALGDKLKLTLSDTEKVYTIENLQEGKALSLDELMDSISISMNGMSPMVSAEVIVGTDNDFLKTVKVEIEDPKEKYANGDVIRVVATTDRQSAMNAGYLIDKETAEKEFPVNGFSEYVTRVDQIPQSVIDRAIELGASYFTDPDSRGYTEANTYGLRIFSEASLVAVWDGIKDYTFQWDSPRIISGYLETLKPEMRDKPGMVYNHLELVYDVHITQGNGAGCHAETLVSFENLMIDGDGNVDLNEDSGQVFAASYLDKNIKNSIRGWNENTYDITRIESITPQE